MYFIYLNESTPVSMYLYHINNTDTIRVLKRQSRLYRANMDCKRRCVVKRERIRKSQAVARGWSRYVHTNNTHTNTHTHTERERAAMGMCTCRDSTETRMHIHLLHPTQTPTLAIQLYTPTRTQQRRICMHVHIHRCMYSH